MMKFLPHWDYYPRSYTVQRVPASGVSPLPLIDEVNGDLTKDVWANVPWSEPFGDIQGHDRSGLPLQPALTQFKALYDDSYLYIGALLHPSPEVPATEAHFVHRNDPIFQKDSDFEVFIDIAGCNHQYKELEINAINTVWNLLLDKPYMDGGVEHSGRIAQPGDPLYYDVKQQKTAVRVLDGAVNDHEHGQALWSVEMALSYKDLYQTIPDDGVDDGRGASVVAPSSVKPPQPGDFWRINFSRVEEKGDINWTWQPQLVWNTATHEYKGVIDMHAPEAWGYFHFADGNRTAEPDHDPTWPLRLAAMQIYHAQRAFMAHNNSNDKGYATSIQELKDLLDAAILEPFDVHFFVMPNMYKVMIKSEHDSMVATIDQERYLVLQDMR